MTFTIDSEASPEEWKTFLEAIEAESGGKAPERPVHAGETGAGSPAPPDRSAGGGDPELLELLSEVWGFQVGFLPGR